MSHHYRVVVVPLDEDGIEEHDVKRGDFILHPGETMTLVATEFITGVRIEPSA